MPWTGVTESKLRMRVLENFKLNYYSVTDLAEGFGISRKPTYLPSTGSSEIRRSVFRRSIRDDDLRKGLLGELA